MLPCDEDGRGGAESGVLMVDSSEDEDASPWLALLRMYTSSVGGRAHATSHIGCFRYILNTNQLLHSSSMLILLTFH